MSTAKYHIANLFFILSLAIMSPLISAEQVTWDAQAALKLSDDLFSAARQLNMECRQSPPRYDDGSTSSHIGFRYHVRHFMSVASDLSHELEDGKNKPETQAIVDTLENIMIELKKYSTREAGGPWPVVSKAVSKADVILVRLSDYYSQ